MSRIFSGGGLTLNAIIGGLGATDNRALRSDGTGGLTAQGSDVVIDDSGNIGTNAVTPTHSLTIPSTGTGGAFYGTADTTANYERLVIVQAAAANPTIAFEKGGSGTARAIRITTNAGASGLQIDSSGGSLQIIGNTSNQAYISPLSSTVGMLLQGKITTGTVAGVDLTALNSYTASSGAQVHTRLLATANQTGMASWDGLLGEFTITAVGSGGGNLMRLRAGATDRFKVGTNGQATVAAGTATPAGGSTTAALLFGTTAGFGVYYGSGAPSVTAGQGSFYMRSDGSSTITRAYINTDGATTWTPITTVG